jgi:HEAT repeat protein
MKKLLMALLSVLLVTGMACEQRQAITKLEVGRSKLLGSDLVTESVTSLKEAEIEEGNKTEPKALLLIAYTYALDIGDAKAQGHEAEYLRERTRRLAEMDKAQMKTILNVLNERHRVQDSARKVLIDKGIDVIPLLIESVVKRHYVNLREGELLDMLHQIGSDVLTQVIEAIRDVKTPPSVKIDLVRLVGRIGDANAVSDLELSRNRKDPALYMEINAALYKLGKEEYKKEIVEGLGNSDVAVRRSATKAMQDLKDSPTAETIKVLDDSDAQVRLYAVQALKKFPDQNATDTFVQILKSDSNENVKASASEALATYASQGLAKGLAHKLAKELMTGEISLPKDRVRVVQLLAKETLRKQIQALPIDIRGNLEFDLDQYRKNTEENPTVQGELRRLLVELESK